VVKNWSERLFVVPCGGAVPSAAVDQILPFHRSGANVRTGQEPPTQYREAAGPQPPRLCRSWPFRYV